MDIAAAGAAGALSNVFGFNVTTQGTVPPGQNIFLEVELANGVFSRNVVPADAVSGNLSGVVIDSGGQAGDSSVRFLLTTATPGPISTIPFDLPIRATGCDVSVAVTEFETEVAGTPIEGGTASLAAPAVTCASAFSASLAPDASLTQLVSAATPAYSDFATAAPDVADSAVLGNFAVTVNTGVQIALNDGATPPATVAASATQIDGYSLIATLENAAGIATIGNTGGNIFAAGSQNVTGSSVALSSAAVGAPTTPATATFTIGLNGTTPASVAAQNIGISAATLDLAAANFLNDEAFASASVEPLTYDGQYFGPFDWVADANGLVNNIFRITGLPGSDVGYQLIVENSSKGESFNGVFSGTLLGSNTTNGEARLNRTGLTSVAGEFGTADISMVFNTVADLDVDRLMASPMNAVVSSFGDGANSDGTGAANPTTPATTTNDDVSQD